MHWSLRLPPDRKKNPFLDMLSEEMLRSVQDAYNYSGIYISYSLSSSTNALKVEPYLITTSENNGYVKVVHMSAYNTTHFGTGIFSNHQNSYIIFNERESPQMALFTIYLQLPMYDFPHMLKGLLPLSRLQPQPDSPKEYCLSNTRTAPAWTTSWN